MKEKKSLFDIINLQLFAETEDTEDFDDTDIDIDEEDGFEFEMGDDEPEYDNTEADVDDTEEEQEEAKPKPKKTNENVVGKAVQAERNKWKKRLAKMQEEIESIKSQPHSKADEADDEISKLLIDSGFDEGTAKKIKGVLSKNSTEVESIKKSVASNFHKMEIKQLKADPLYSDIEDYETEVISLANKTGLSIEQAYLAMFGKDKLTKNLKDREREIEQRVISNIQKRKAGSINTTSDGGTIKSKNQYKLSADEIEIAKMSGMTPKEYYSFKNYKTIDKINSVLDKKK